MKTSFLRLLTALPLTAVLGCDAVPPPTAVDVPQQRELVASAVSTGFTFDSTAIATPPSGGLPSVLLTRTAFEDAAVHRALLETSESFSLTGGLASRRDHESLTWKLERNPFSGSLLALRKTESGPATPQEPALLQRRALARLQAWGIPSAEMGPVRQVQALFQNEESRVVGAPELLSHKTFVLRALNGIRVEGHRAVVTHGVDGAFQRTLIKWPPLARQGHLLRTRLTPAEIEQRASEVLLREGETAGPVRLFWRYVPTELSTGEVTLTLQVSAAMPSFTGASSTEEPRVVDVDVSAVP
ncbi:hypothetical protein D7X74_00065 [Corallococcus sp. CA047B]|uniref:hypothetical protein n=1 Tax=Corallococcus sp. CA047B TaxID=2316729 RepID=UPI000EA2A10B|nr:hypothetical protein [Corallococcus sp. CA047B]RKH21762.1 hypothetical protein D7X74_00065 [Corallococcus sp. CA047B]